LSKDTRNLILALGTPLVLALAGWINAHAGRVSAEKETAGMSDSFQEYIEYVMKQRGCEP
jgi:hypothetical protein